MEDDMGRGMAGGLNHLPGAEVGLDLDPRYELAVGLLENVDPGLAVAARLAVALQRRRRDPALPRHLDPRLERRLWIVGKQPHVLPVRVHPELAAGPLADRAGEA